MVYTLYKPNLWGYSKGNFIYRVNFFYRKAVEILMSVVIGALILTGLYLLFKDNILPGLTQRITDMFNFSG